MNPTFTFSAEQWPHRSGSWVFVTVPEDESDEIQQVAPHLGGFGSVRVQVSIGTTQWRTSDFPSAEIGCFVLPTKKSVRKAEAIETGDTATVELTVLMD